MKVYAISDLHLSLHCPKPMDIFGGQWENYVERIEEDWVSRVTDEDVVLVGGDISWAMTLSQAVPDLDYIGRLPGKKVLVRGNHDYWWSGIGKVRGALTGESYALQNDAVRLNGLVVAGSRGWSVPDDPLAQDAHDAKIYAREAERLELSLKGARALMRPGDRLICLMHYPPFNVRREDSRFTDLFHKYGAAEVVYGHLHGSGCRTDLVIKKGGITYYLTSCDQLSNRLALIGE